MSFGLRCFDEGGSVYFDSTTQNHYRLIGKFVSRVEGDYAYGTYIRIPSQYNNEDHLFCVGLKDWRSQRFGDKGYISIYNDGMRINFRRIGRVHYQDPDAYVTPVEVFVFTKKPDVNTARGFGLVCYDENMGMTFSTFNSSHCLQINDYKSQSSPFIGVVGIGNAVLISTLPYQAFASSAGHARWDSSIFRTEGGVVESSYATIGSQYVGGGFSFHRFAVATVQIPDIPIPTLNW